MNNDSFVLKCWLLVGVVDRGFFFERLYGFFWRIENAIVKRWLLIQWIQSNCIIFTMAKAEWDAIAAIYFDGSDTSQAYDLKKNIMRLKQVWRINILQLLETSCLGMALKVYLSKLCT